MLLIWKNGKYLVEEKTIKQKEIIMEEQSLENIIKHRCIEIVDEPNITYVDYHIISNQEKQDELNGAYLVNHIIEQRFFPNGRWDV